MTIKEKILMFLEEMKIKKADFFLKTGIAASNFKGVAMNSELGGDKIVKILTEFPNLSADWLLLSCGSMIRNDQEQPIPQPVIQSAPPGDDSFIYSMYKEEKEGKEALIEEIGGLKERIRTLESKLQEYEPQPEASKEEIKVLGHAKNATIKKPSSPNADNATSANVP